MPQRVALMTLTLALLAVGGCALGPAMKRLTLPDQFTVAREQLLLHSDFPLPQHHRLLEDLLMQRAELLRQLGLPSSDEPIHVYLFESPERFEGYVRLHHPEFPNRRAFFVETDTQLKIYAQWGERVGEDLRHEITHAYLHAVVGDLPLWLDEGLAKYYETPRGQHGLNRRQLDHLAQRVKTGSWQPDLRRLEAIDPSQDLNLDQYAQSWAWVHWLLESRPENAEVLRGYLADLRRGGPTTPLSARLQQLVPSPSDALIEHVRALLIQAAP